LRTIDGGAHWKKCAVPDAAEDGSTLDFRGVQAWDAETAIVMSSGKGRLSRLYKTKDGCKAWKLVFKNPDIDGFWDALYFGQGQYGWLLGDPVRGMFSLFFSYDTGRTWIKQRNKGLRVKQGSQAAFAASNSSLSSSGSPDFGSGGTAGAFMFSLEEVEICIHCSWEESDVEGRRSKWSQDRVPVGKDTDSSGIFSIGLRDSIKDASPYNRVLVAVGGDYSSPNETLNTAAFKISYDRPWTASTTPPHGFRSAVQWSEALKAWITVGTNGSDISRDDGKTWQPLDDGNWNALSLPFVVGPNGRIAKMNPAALAVATVTKGTPSGTESTPDTVK